MTKYAQEPEDKSKAAMAKGSNLRVHFKNSRETAKAIHGMSLAKAKSYLEDVIEHKRCIVFRRFCGGVGRTALAKNEGSTNGQVGYFPHIFCETVDRGIFNGRDVSCEKPRACLACHSCYHHSTPGHHTTRSVSNS
jgi:ribosomal protein L22